MTIHGVCLRERDGERESVCVCVCVREREGMVRGGGGDCTVGDVLIGLGLGRLSIRRGGQVIRECLFAGHKRLSIRRGRS